MTHILRIDSSARRAGSVTRELTGRIVERLRATGPVSVTERDLADGVPLIDETWVAANFTAPEARTPEQVEALAFSDKLVAELQDADVIVIGVPMYNFAIPASLKAWIDLVTRAGVTFRYTPNGPEGLLKGKRAILAVATGGTDVGSAIDFATRYMRHILGFIGITDVEVVHADRVAIDAEAALREATAEIEALPLAA